MKPAPRAAVDERAFALFAVLGVAAAALLGRVVMLEFESRYVELTLSPFYRAALGRPFSILADNSLGALPPAAALFELATVPLRELVPWPKLAKLPALALEPLVAFAVWGLVRREAPGWRAGLAAAAALLAPSTLLRGAWLGWADSAWAAFALLCVWAVCAGRSRLAATWFALGAGFGAPALAMAPLLAIAGLRRQFDWIASYVAALILLVIVAATAVLTLDWGEAVWRVVQFHREPMANPRVGVAPSLYMFMTPHQPSVTAPFGLALLALAVVVLVVLAARDRRPMTGEQVCLTAWLCAATASFGLPYASARFTFAADLLAIALAGINPAWIALAIGQQLVSALACLPAGGLGADAAAPLGAALNLVLLPWGFARWLRLVDRDGVGARLPEPAAGLLARALAAVAATYFLWLFALRLLGLLGVDLAQLWPYRRQEFAGFVTFAAVALALAPAWLRLERVARARLAAAPAE